MRADRAYQPANGQRSSPAVLTNLEWLSPQSASRVNPEANLSPGKNPSLSISYHYRTVNQQSNILDRYERCSDGVPNEPPGDQASRLWKPSIRLRRSLKSYGFLTQPSRIERQANGDDMSHSNCVLQETSNRTDNTDHESRQSFLTALHRYQEEMRGIALVRIVESIIVCSRSVAEDDGVLPKNSCDILLSLEDRFRLFSISRPQTGLTTYRSARERLENLFF